MKKIFAVAAVLAAVLGFAPTASAQHCAAPVVQQVVQPVYATPQAVVVAPVVTPAAIVVPSVPLAVVQPVYQPAAIVQQLQVQKVVQPKQVIRQRITVR